jgi:hypothetical protein
LARLRKKGRERTSGREDECCNETEKRRIWETKKQRNEEAPLMDPNSPLLFAGPKLFKKQQKYYH